MDSVVITGGAGLQGSRLARRLLEMGRKVTVADNFSRGSSLNLENIKDAIQIRRVDLRKPEECLEVFRDVDTVFHLAAHLGGVEYAHGSSSMSSHGVSMGTDNMLIDTNVIRACINNKVERLLYTSTACIYPVELQMTADAPPLREKQAYPANAESPYGWAKLMGEIICQACAKENGLKVAIVRLFNVYGEGEDMSPGSHVIPELMRKAIWYPDEDFVVYGDGSQTRAFTYVDDAVEGLIAAMERYATADPINIGGEETISVRELAERIVLLSGKRIPLKFEISRPVGVRGRRADITKARTALGWFPRVSMDVGLKKTFDWALRHSNRK